MSSDLNRRSFIKNSSLLVTAGALTASTGLNANPQEPKISLPPSKGEHRGRIYKSIKFQMFRGKMSYLEKFQMLKDMGYDGVELNSPNGENKKEALKASKAIDFPLHGCVDSIHWGRRLSDKDPKVREMGLQGLITAIKDTHYIGGSAVLLVPGRVSHPETENQQQVWDRSIEQIHKVLPLASKLGIHILIENVWNGFCYIHNGPSDQTAEKLRDYIDAIDSPWIGVYFDIGNHQKYGKPAEWIRTLGRRIVKLDVKDWGKKNGFCKIGEGDVDWADVRKALKEIKFTGWSTAEVGGGNADRIQEIAERMNRALGL